LTVANPSAPSTRGNLKSIFGASVGNLVEWYDWYTYTALSLYFAKSFFPSGDTTAQLLNVAAVFAVGFLMRPIGGWLIGSYADRYGRKAALVLSVLLMSFGSLLIAITPGYATIGIWAPILLVIARLMQGLSVGGEYGTSATYLAEIAPGHQRGFYSSFQYVTLIMGQLSALVVLIFLQFVFLTPEQLHEWGWRIPFVIGAIAAVVAMYLRRNLAESEAFTVAQPRQRKESSLRKLLRYPRQIFIVVGLTLGGTVAFYSYTTYTQKFLVNTTGFSKEEATAITALALFVFMCLQPVIGALSDRIGRRPLLIAFGILGTLLTVPIMSSLAVATNYYSAFALVMAALVIVSGYTSINAVVKAELFPTEIRAIGVGLPYALTVSVFGGTAEYLALKAKAIGHEPMFYYYVSGCILVSLLVYVFMADTRDTDLTSP